MVMQPPRRELRRLGAEAHRGRSEAYAYIIRNLDRFTELGVGTKHGPPWSSFAQSLGRAGLTNKDGNPISADSARKLFERVRCAVDEAKEAKKFAQAAKPPRKLQPRDMPKDWRPTPIPPPDSVSVPRPLPADIDPTDPFARVRVGFDIASGRRNPEGEKL